MQKRNENRVKNEQLVQIRKVREKRIYKNERMKRDETVFSRIYGEI